MKILVLGGNGQLGTEISKSLSKISNLTSLSRDQLDITDKNEVKKYSYMWTERGEYSRN